MVRWPSDSPAATRTCNCTPPRSASTNGAVIVNSSTRSQPTSSPARNANSTNAVPGSNTRPNTTCSANHGWVRTDNRPVNTTP